MFKNFAFLGSISEPVEDLLDRKILNFLKDHCELKEVQRSSLSISHFEVDGEHLIFMGVTCEFEE